MTGRQMYSKIKPFLFDFLIGLFILAFSIIGLFQFNSVVLCFITASLLSLIVSFYRAQGKKNKPWLSFILINIGLIFLFIDVSLKTSVFYLLTLLPILSLSFVGLYLGQYWSNKSLLMQGLALGSSFVLVGFIYFNTASLNANSIYTQYLNESFTAFELPLMNGSLISTDKLKGKVVVLNFGLLSDVNVRKTLQQMSTVSDQYCDNTQVEHFFISTSKINESKQSLVKRTQKYIDENNPSIVFAYDFEGIRHYFRTFMLPAIIILDKAGKIRIKRSGYFKEREVVSLINKEIALLLAE